MPEPTTYEVVLWSPLSERMLRPLLDDFTVEPGQGPVTRLVGEVRDPSHLHGVLAHLTSLNAEILSVVQLGGKGAAVQSSW